jgi:hypothetical protein
MPGQQKKSKLPASCVTGIGGDLSIEPGEVAPLAEYSVPGTLDAAGLRTGTYNRD